MGKYLILQCQRRRRSHSSSTSLPEVCPLPSPRPSWPLSRESSSSSRCSMPTQTSPRSNNTAVSAIASPESCRSKVHSPSGEVTWLTSSVTSQLRPSTSPARIPTRPTFAHSTPRPSQSSSSSVTWPPVVLLVPLPSASCTHWISPVQDSLLMSDPAQKERESSTVSLTASGRLPLRMALVVSTRVSVSPSLVSFSTELPTSVFSTLVRLCSLVQNRTFSPPSCSDRSSPSPPVSSPTHLIP